jgi:hypothetical protein
VLLIRQSLRALLVLACGAVGALAYGSFLTGSSAASAVQAHRYEPGGRGSRYRLPGDDLSDPIVIPSLPFSVLGTTCGYNDGFTAPCGGGIPGPDVVYAFTPTENGCMQVDLCGSSFETIVSVYEDSIGRLLGCTTASCLARTQLGPLQFAAGRTYYLIVDAGGPCRDYELHVEACSTCRPVCPPGAISEGEGNCFDDYDNSFNGGCSVDPPTFTDLPCTNDTLRVCGTYGIFGTGFVPTLDLDWYQLTLSEPGPLRACLQGEGRGQFIVLGPACGNYTILYDRIADRCGTLCCDLDLPAGTYHLLVRNAPTHQVVPCGAGYLLQIEPYACTPSAVREAPWSRVKQLYRGASTSR